MTNEIGPKAETLQERIAAFLAAHSTLVLATADREGRPAAAAMFYAHDSQLNLYFLSEAKTRHALNLATNPRVAGTVQADGQDWRRIQGLQVRGIALPVSISELAHVATVYGRKYAFVAALMAGTGGPAVLSGPLARARFYALRPSWYRLIDNTVRFGFKEELVLAQGEGDEDGQAAS